MLLYTITDVWLCKTGRKSDMEFLSFHIFQNGVKQGGMLSPTLFNLYIDRLLVTLKNSGLGCHINGTYMGPLSLC